MEIIHAQRQLVNCEVTTNCEVLQAPHGEYFKNTETPG